MVGQPGLVDIDERQKDLSAKGDDLEPLNAIVDFELIRPDLEHAVPRSDRVKGGRPPYDHVLTFRVLILQASHSLSDERTEYLIKDRLSFMRFSWADACRSRAGRELDLEFPCGAYHGCESQDFRTSAASVHSAGMASLSGWNQPIGCSCSRCTFGE